MLERINPVRPSVRRDHVVALLACASAGSKNAVVVLTRPMGWDENNMPSLHRKLLTPSSHAPSALILFTTASPAPGNIAAVHQHSNRRRVPTR